MERKIGEIFTYKGKTYQVVKAATCIGCAFRERICGLFKSYIGKCTPSTRSDKTSVIFKEIKGMEIKNNQLTIDIPEGMEIDVENSDLSEGIVKLKKKGITYENVEDALKLGKNCKSIIINESNASKLVALNKLMNIANYYNKGWKPDFCNNGEDKYYIGYSKSLNKYDINLSVLCTYTFLYFKNSEDARTVINNPNFRDILDTIYKD